MITYIVVGTIAVSSAILERRARNSGNTDVALAAKRFGRYFLLGAVLVLIYHGLHVFEKFMKIMF